MLKKPRVRKRMGRYHVKGSEKLLKSERHYFCHIFWLFRKKISSKNSILVVSEILRHFVNILTPDEMYCLSVKASVSRKHSNGITCKPKNVFWIFLIISKIYIIFGILWSKRWASKIICFLNYRLQKAELLKCIQSPASEHLSKANMLKGPENSLNLHKRILVIFFGHSGRYSARKILFW